MRTYTNSQTVEEHDDGSKTVTTVETIDPVSIKQQAVAGGLLGLLVVAPFLPIIASVISDKVRDRREARKADKLEEKTD